MIPSAFVLKLSNDADSSPSPCRSGRDVSPTRRWKIEREQEMEHPLLAQFEIEMGTVSAETELEKPEDEGDGDDGAESEPAEPGCH